MSPEPSTTQNSGTSSTNGTASSETVRNGIAPIFAGPEACEAAIDKAVREAIRRHKRLGESIAVWRDGRVVIIPPEEIPEDL